MSSKIYSKTEITKMKKLELISVLKTMDLDCSGKLPELKERLRNAYVSCDSNKKNKNDDNDSKNENSRIDENNRKLNNNDQQIEDDQQIDDESKSNEHIKTKGNMELEKKI